MHVVRFRDKNGNVGEIKAGANFAQAKAVVDKIYVGKGAEKEKHQIAAKRLGLEAPVTWFKILKRPGRFAGVALVGGQKEEVPGEETKKVSVLAGGGKKPRQAKALTLLAG